MNAINLLLILAIASSLIIMIQLVLKKRRVFDFHILIIAMLVWLAFELIHYNVSNTYILNLTNNLRYLGIVFVPVFGFTFSLKYSRSLAKLPVKYYLVLLVIPFFSLLSVMTNDMHQLFYTSTTRHIRNNIAYLSVSYGPLFYVHTIYSYALILLMQYNIFSVSLKFKGLLRSQSMLLIFSVLIPFIGNTFYLVSNSIFDYTPLFFSLSALLIYIALYRAQFFDVLPIGQSLILEHIDIGYIIINESGKIITINNYTAQLLEISINQWLSKPFDNLLKFIDASNLQNEFTIYHNNRIISCIKHGIYDVRDVKIGDVITLKNVTTEAQTTLQLEHAKNRALQSDQIKTRFLASVSHELRSPIEAILKINNDMKTSENQDAAFAIDEACHISLNILDGLKSYTENNEYTLSIKNEYVFLEDIIKEMKITFDPLLEQRGITYTIQYPDNMRLYGLLDRHHFEQIIVNILNNIIKYARLGSMIISMNSFEELLSLNMQIKGFALPKEVMPILFDTKELQGNDLDFAGLGLSLTKRIAQKMNGDITCTSDHIDETTFTIDLPFKAIDQSVPEDLDEYPFIENLKIGILSTNSLQEMYIIKYLNELEIKTYELSRTSLVSGKHHNIDVLLVNDTLMADDSIRESLHSMTLLNIPKILLVDEQSVQHEDPVSTLFADKLKNPVHLPTLIHKILHAYAEK